MAADDGVLTPRRRGRPPLGDAAATIPVVVRFTPTQRGALERVAQNSGTPMSNVIRKAVNRFVLDYRDHPVFPKR